jgi:hypothetical protein
MDNVENETALMLQQQWDLALPDHVSEEAILEQLARRVAHMLDGNPEDFFQLMYRLDISEKKLHGVMLEDDVAMHIARLIYDRQMQKIKSRHDNPATTDVDPELQW